MFFKILDVGQCCRSKGYHDGRCNLSHAVCISKLSACKPDNRIDQLEERIKNLESLVQTKMVEYKASLEECKDNHGKYVQSMERTRSIIEGLLSKENYYWINFHKLWSWLNNLLNNNFFQQHFVDCRKNLIRLATKRETDPMIYSPSTVSVFHSCPFRTVAMASALTAMLTVASSHLKVAIVTWYNLDGHSHGHDQNDDDCWLVHDSSSSGKQFTDLVDLYWFEAIYTNPNCNK